MIRQNLCKVVGVVLLLCGLQVHGQRAALGATYVTFDIPGSVGGPTPTGINPKGEIAGYYSDANNAGHSFLRTPDGAIATFDPPGAISSTSVGITPEGAITGSYSDANNAIRGFLRAGNGAFTAFDAATGANITSPAAINPEGAITGSYFGGSISIIFHGFVRSPYGAITTFDVPGASNTSPTAINPAGAITGFYFLNGSSAYHGFVRARTGALTTFDVPSGVFTQPVAIDPAGAITGNYEDANGVLHGFLREGAGAITTFDAPGLNIRTQPVGITPAGAIAGWNLLADLSAAHGFLRARNGTFTIFDPPESKGTITTAINLEGAITGTYFDANNVGHGFLRIPCERCDEAASNSLNQPVPIRPMGSVLLYRMRILANHDLHHSLLPGLPY